MDEIPWIKARMIIEVAGMPESHVSDTLLVISTRFGEKRKDLKVTDKKIGEPKQAEKSKFFTGFVELEFDAKNLEVLFGVVLDYLPSSIEILEPENLKETAFNLNGILNEMTGRLHAYDATVKTLKAEKLIIGRELKKYLPGKEIKMDQPAPETKEETEKPEQ